MGIDVRGGSAGFGVGLDEVEGAARLLALAAEEAAGLATKVALSAVEPHLLASQVLSPASGAKALAALARACGPQGLAGEAAALGALGLGAHGAVQAYRAGERAVATSAAVAEDTVMYALGAHAPEIAVGVLALSVLAPEDLDLGALVDQAAFAHPWVGDLGGGTRGLELGVEINPVTGPAVRLASALRLAPQHDLAGRPADDRVQSLRVLADSAALAGLLREDATARVTAEAHPRPGARAPACLADLGRDLANLGDDAAYPARVRVVEVAGTHESAWLVEIPGTQSWAAHAGSNPFDVTTDVRLMAQESTALADAVQQALAAAQAASGRDTAAEPVMLAGHSLGGIVAAGLASSPRFRAAHRVTHVVTMGAPVAGMPVPESVQVLSLEHVQDVVPRLDGRANPDRRSWVTVTRDLQGDAHGVVTASGSHGLEEYAETGGLVDAASDGSIPVWRATSREFFEPAADGRAVVRDYRIARGP